MDSPPVLEGDAALLRDFVTVAVRDFVGVADTAGTVTYTHSLLKARGDGDWFPRHVCPADEPHYKQTAKYTSVAMRDIYSCMHVTGMTWSTVVARDVLYVGFNAAPTRGRVQGHVSCNPTAQGADV